MWCLLILSWLGKRFQKFIPQKFVPLVTDTILCVQFVAYRLLCRCGDCSNLPIHLSLFQPASSISRILCFEGRVKTRLVSNYVRFDVLIWGIVPHDDVLCKF